MTWTNVTRFSFDRARMPNKAFVATGRMVVKTDKVIS
jgi:hypothetical protein